MGTVSHGGVQPGPAWTFTVENIGLAARHGYISVATELSGVFTPSFLTVPSMIDYLAGKATLASEGRKPRETYTQNKQ
jgi:hypothetical protein